MKLKQLFFPLTLAVAVALASTGCKKGYAGRVTPIPGQNQPIAGEGSGSTLPGGDTLNQGNGGPTPTSTAPSGPIAEGPWDLPNMTQDASALAAYTVHFAFDSATVKDSEQANINSVAQALNSDPNAKLLIAGNCDERGTEEYNRALGERRALALREILVKDGIDESRIHTISYGKDKPVDPGHNEAAWSKNRRGDFILCHPKTGV